MTSRLRTRVRALRAVLSSTRYKSWSNRDIFEHIYNEGKWSSGEKEGQFYSGTGSESMSSKLYVDLIRGYIEQNNSKSIADLGCGDFRVGKQICEGLDVQYLGVDIVRPLISYLNANYQNQNIRFLCLDLLEDDLPTADIYLIRQVFQHLSNDQIRRSIKKLSGRTLFVTEHLPTAPAAYNKDKTTGPDIRIYRKSGVFLEHPPFSLKTETLLEVPQPFNGVDAVLRTSLIRSI